MDLELHRKPSYEEQVAQLSAYRHTTYAVEKWTDDYDEHWQEGRCAAPYAESHVITSGIIGTKLHTMMLDLDVPAKLLPSSTEGHSHLYVDVAMSWRKYKRVLRALYLAGVIEPGYYHVSKRRKHTALRLPWVRKEDQ